MKYDDASWHYGGNFPADLPPEAGFIHIGMFLAWAAKAGLVSELLTEDSGEDLTRLLSREVTPGEACELLLDGKMTDQDFTEQGNAFAAAYYSSHDYYGDLENLTKALPSVYHLPDTWDSYERLSAIIDERFQTWQKTLS